MAMAALPLVSGGARLAEEGIKSATQILTKPIISTAEKTVTRIRYDKEGRVRQVDERHSPRIQVGILGLTAAGVIVVVGVQAARGKISIPLLGAGGGGGAAGWPTQLAAIATLNPLAYGLTLGLHGLHVPGF